MAKKKNTKKTTTTATAATTSNVNAPLQLSEEQIENLQQRLQLLQKEKEEDAQLTKHIEEETNAKLSEVNQYLSQPNIDPNSKLGQIHQKYVDQLNENKKVRSELTVTQKRLNDTVLAKQNLYNETRVIIEQKEKLQRLCKELHKQNKAIMDESKLVQDDQERKRQEIAANFQGAINEIHKKMEVEAEQRFEVFKENEVLKAQLETVLKQYELREKQFETELKKGQLEKQLVIAKAREELEKMVEELSRIPLLEKQLELKTKQELDLRKQLSDYSKKFNEIQKTIKQSNKSYKKVTKDMTTMSERIQTLEKEKMELKNEVQQEKIKALQLEKRALESESAAASANAQRDKLKGLCKTLDSDRKKLQEELDQLKRGADGQKEAEEVTNLSEIEQVTDQSTPIAESD